MIQKDKVIRAMTRKKWMTLREIEQLTGIPQASLSARIRELRLPKNGAHTVEVRLGRKGKNERGERFQTYEYSLIANMTKPKQTRKLANAGGSNDNGQASLTNFRALTETEQGLLTKLRTKGKMSGAVERIRNIKVGYVHDGNFTLALVRVNSNKLFAGEAKRNPTDKFNASVGEQLAFARAMRRPPVSIE